MRIVAHVHMAAPEHGAGAEWMLHTILRDLVERGHECVCLVTRGSSGLVDGVAVQSTIDPDVQQHWWEWADVAITHLDETMRAMILCSKTKTPLVHLVHNDTQLAHHGVSPAVGQLVVWNSQWIADAWAGRWGGESIVVRPPIRAADYKVPRRGTHVTMVNTSLAKGVMDFYEAAVAMPHRPFLAVQGAYHDQVPPPALANLTVIPNQPRMKPVYADTRVLVMLSAYESYGRCAMEAAVSGIPTIAAPTPGLVEALGDAGIWCSPGDRVTLQLQLDALYNDEAYYRKVSAACRARSRAVQASQRRELASLDTHLRGLVGTVPGGFERLHPSQAGWMG